MVLFIYKYIGGISLKTSNVLFFTLFSMIVTSMTVTPQKSFAQNEIKMNDAETTVTHVLDQSTRLFNTALVNEIDNEKTGIKLPVTLD